MKNNSNPKKFLDVQELSVLESDSIRGGVDTEIAARKEKRKIKIKEK